MLVVITIIALLVALLLPAVKKAKQQARYLVCATQQRQIVMGILQNTIENNEDLPFGQWSSPTVIGNAAEIIINIQGSNVWHGDHDGPPVDVAMQIFTCPEFLTRSGTGISVYDPYDRALYGEWPYSGWGSAGYLPVGSTAVHTTYLYLGGNGHQNNNTNGSSWWHGWVAYDGNTYAAYADPFDFGPVPSLSDRRRHSEVGLLTDRMWLTDPSCPLHPFRVTDVGGHECVPNHKVRQYETIGGNVAYVDGHVEWKWVDHIQERVHSYYLGRPYVCY